MLEELERVRAPHWAGHLVVLLLDWCRSEMMHSHAGASGAEVPRVSLIALGIYAGLKVPRAFDVFSGGASSSSRAAPGVPVMVPPPPGIPFPEATADATQPRKIFRGSNNWDGDFNSGASAAAHIPVQFSSAPPPPPPPDAAFNPNDPLFEYWGGKKTFWVAYDHDTQLLLRASHAAGGSTVQVVCQGTRYYINTRPDVMEQSNPITGQGPRKIRIRPPDYVD